MAASQACYNTDCVGAGVGGEGWIKKCKEKNYPDMMIKQFLRDTLEEYDAAFGDPKLK